MKRLLLAVIIFTIFSLKISAQVDTVVTYLDKQHSSCKKDTAFIISKLYKTDDGWHKQMFYMSSNLIFLHQTTADKEGKILHGAQEQFFDDGKLKSRYVYNNTKVVSGHFFYPTGQLNGEASYDNDGKIIKEKGYDENGKSIKGYFFIKESEFKDGQRGWISYLQQNLKSDVPSRNGAPVGKYSVVVNFLIDKMGKVMNVTAENNPGYGTTEEAIRVFLDSPLWEPAIYNGKNVISRKRQSITFLVDNK